MREISAENLRVLVLGRQGEHLAAAVAFDLSSWRRECGDGQVELLVRRPGECTPYPAAVKVCGDVARWVLTRADTGVSGAYGECELRYYAGETLRKSRIWRTYVEPALWPHSPPGCPPHGPPDAPAQTWVDQVLMAGVQVERAAEAAAKPPYPDGKTGTWWIWKDGAYQDSGQAFSGDGKSASDEEVAEVLAEVFGAAP